MRDLIRFHVGHGLARCLIPLVVAGEKVDRLRDRIVYWAERG